MSIGTPSGFSQSPQIAGHWAAGVVKRAFGWAAGSFLPGDQPRPRQSTACAGGAPPIPSHQISPSSVRAQFVKMTFFLSESIAFAFDLYEVPGATPKKPASGLIARSRPSGPIFIQEISSPTHSVFQPGRVGTSIARLVLPQAEGKAAAR